jgi:hypothetical protein
MACAVLPYAPARFAALRDLGAATEAFAAAREGGAVRTLTALLAKHGLADVAGVMLLHAHFSLASDERLVQRDAVRGPHDPGTRHNMRRPLASRLGPETGVRGRVQACALRARARVRLRRRCASLGPQRS